MGKSSEKFLEEREMDVFCIMSEKHYRELATEQRENMKSVDFRESNEYLDNKDDPIYMKLYKDNKKTKKELQEYLFNKRHN